MLFVAATTEQLSDVAWLHSVIAICEGAPQTVMFAPMLAILFDGRRAGEWLAKMKAAGILPNLLSYNSAAKRLRQEDHRLRRHFLHPWRSLDALRR